MLYVPSLKKIYLIKINLMSRNVDTCYHPPLFIIIRRILSHPFALLNFSGNVETLDRNHMDLTCIKTERNLSEQIIIGYVSVQVINPI